MGRVIWRFRKRFRLQRNQIFRSEIFVYDTRVVGGEPKFQLQFPLMERRPIIGLNYVPKQPDHPAFPCSGQFKASTVTAFYVTWSSRSRPCIFPSYSKKYILIVMYFCCSSLFDFSLTQVISSFYRASCSNSWITLVLRVPDGLWFVDRGLVQVAQVGHQRLVLVSPIRYSVKNVSCFDEATASRQTHGKNNYNYLIRAKRELTTFEWKVK